MANEKQRRRRAKEKRHDYDLVFIDEEGVERPVEREDGPRKPPARIGRGGGSTSNAQKSQPTKGSRRSREIHPPSWRRVLRRGAIFAPIFFATVLLLGGDKMTTSGAVVQSILLIAVFVPFSYFMDRVVWRQHQKRLARDS